MTNRSITVLWAVGIVIGFSTISQKGRAMYKPAKKIPHVMDIHGDKRVDNYFWMKERDSEPVLEYLRQENERAAEALRPVAGLEEKLLAEMQGRIKQDDSSVPKLDRGYYYYSRFQEGQEYAIHARKKGSLEAPEQVILDENKEAKGQAYYEVGSVELSPDQNIMAFAVDTVGRRKYTVRFRDLTTGRELPDVLTEVTPSFVWAPDNKTLFYVNQDKETLRAYQLYRYQLGSKAPVLVYEEKDDTFSIDVGGSKDGRHLYLVSEKRGESSEWRILDGTNPEGPWDVFLPRENKHEYSLEDGGDRVYILTNWQAPNFRVMEAPFTARAKNQWKPVTPHEPKIFRQEVEAFKTHLLISERENGLTRLRVIDRKTGQQRQVAFNDPTYEVEMAALPDYESTFLRFTYQTPGQPTAVYDEEFESSRRVLRKEKEVPTFNKALYEVRRIWAKAKDGVEVPISVLLKKGTQLDGKNPALIYGYGSYGLNNDASFWGSIFSLVDRGFVFAKPHIRGGSEMGREWYETGRMKHKMNTFTDFIAATEKLMSDGYVAKDRAYMMGGSAGGLLMGAVMNMRPDLYKGVVAQVPFVDVLTTMLDETLPLTTGEYPEWGDPRKKDEYMYMRQYLPYDNVQAKKYPNIFVQTGYHDSQVQYWEPAKWVAKLRELKTDDNLLLFYTELQAGHSGASGRFESLKVLAKQFAFILMLEGLTN